ncbi:hypothetical protein FA15DRAFT_666595 [Coprinopsis marcescibilis]|uniref:Uncharacterized protein n=1 Tax=Coprinopsis marcescibilis TaxID=230819 RepID=A0A5C3L3J1_COPMA|nr:hypothetical protein FA15DRAFT_666595 [Coprinopsis marcescibilis]
MSESTASANDLPPEILTEIFVLSSECNTGVEKWCKGYHHPITYLQRGKDEHVNPVLLGQVCRLWRDLALSLPSLWTTIIVQEPQSQAPFMLDLWLERSGNDAPLRLAAICDNYRAGSSMKEVLARFMTLAHRWHWIRLEPCGISVEWVSKMLPAKAKISMQLDVVCLWLQRSARTRFSDGLVVEDRHYRNVSDVFFSLPNLKAFWSNQTDLPCNISLQSCESWNSLFLINLAVVTVVDLFSHFPSIQHLQHLYIGDLRGADITSQKWPSFPICIPRLQVLKIGKVTSIAVADVFDCLTLPALTTLCTHISCDPTRIYVEALEDLLARSSTELRHLDIGWEYGSVSQNKLLFLLRSPALSTLEYIRIGYAMRDLAISAITHTSNAMLLPNLKTIILPKLRSTDGLLSAMVRSRVSTYPSKLRRVCTNLDSSCSPQDSSLEVAGVKVDIDYPGRNDRHLHVPWSI